MPSGLNWSVKPANIVKWSNYYLYSRVSNTNTHLRHAIEVGEQICDGNSPFKDDVRLICIRDLVSVS